MQFQVPQFINIEDKILGPFTIKQFIYLVGGTGMVYIIYRFLPFYLAILVIAPIATFALLLAFAKPNGKPFIFLVQAAILYLISGRLYLWKRTPKKMTPNDAAKELTGNAPIVPALSESKLKDLTWALDINQNVKGQK
ncbi:MAG: PrgI family protein [bacterium]|nr:PrgI family protein [bacterium]